MFELSRTQYPSKNISQQINALKSVILPDTTCCLNILWISAKLSEFVITFRRFFEKHWNLEFEHFQRFKDFSPRTGGGRTQALRWATRSLSSGVSGSSESVMAADDLKN